MCCTPGQVIVVSDIVNEGKSQKDKLWFFSIDRLDLFLLGIPINVIGVLYVIFVLKEVERKPDIELKRVDNPTFQNKNETEGNSVARDNEIPPNGCLIDLFDPSLVVHRENGEQEIIIFLVILYLVSAGVISGRFYSSQSSIRVTFSKIFALKWLCRGLN